MLSSGGIEHRAIDGVATGGTVWRTYAAHSHLYWTGPGRKQPRVKFRLAISLRGALVGEPETK
jgi:hypothetical protein